MLSNPSPTNCELCFFLSFSVNLHIDQIILILVLLTLTLSSTFIGHVCPIAIYISSSSTIFDSHCSSQKLGTFGDCCS